MKRNWLYTIGSLLVGFLLIALWLKFVNLDEILNHLKGLNITYVIIAAFFYLLSYFIRSMRWRKLLSPVYQMSYRQSFFAWMAGNLLNYLVPVRAGELAKSFLLKQSANIPISKSLPSVFIDKLFDSAAILLVLILIPFISVRISPQMLFLLIVLVLIVVVEAGFLLYAALAHHKLADSLSWISRLIPGKYKGKFENLFRLFIEGTGLFKNHFNLLPLVILLTFSAVLVDSIYFSFIFKAFGQSEPFLKILFGYTLIYLSYVIPQPPAQLGSNEWIMVIIFSVGMAMNKELVSAVMAFAHLLTGFIVITLGLFSLSYFGISVKNYFFKKLETGESENEKK